MAKKSHKGLTARQLENQAMRLKQKGNSVKKGR